MTKLTLTDRVMHRIPTIDDIPVFSKQYKFIYSMKQEILKQVQELLEADIIKPSNFYYSTPLWIVQKKQTRKVK